VFLETCFNDRHDWLKLAFNQYRDTLPAEVRDFLQTKTSRGKALVWGETQQGKTTLIMSLLGIRRESENDLALTLRGGATSGKPATPVPIFYERATGSSWKVSEGEQELLTTTSAEAVAHKIGALRREMSHGHRQYVQPLRIAIPVDYFEADECNTVEGILDVPGKNPFGATWAEHKYVQDVATLIRGFPIVFIVSKANDSFKMFTNDSGVPGIAQWWTLPEKFKLVLTEVFTLRSNQSARPEELHAKHADEINRQLMRRAGSMSGSISAENLLTVEIGDSQKALELKCFAGEEWAARALSTSARNLQMMAEQVRLAHEIGHEVQILNAAGRIAADQLRSAIESTNRQILVLEEKLNQFEARIDTFAELAEAEQTKFEQMIKVQFGFEALARRFIDEMSAEPDLDFIAEFDGSESIGVQDPGRAVFDGLSRRMSHGLEQVKICLLPTQEFGVNPGSAIKQIAKFQNDANEQLAKCSEVLERRFGKHKLGKKRVEYSTVVKQEIIDFQVTLCNAFVLLM